MLKRLPILIALLLSAMLFTACGSSVSPETYAQPRETIQAAAALGAEENPQAELYLMLAKEQVTKAEKLMGDDEEEEARWMLARAQADAQLALAYAKLVDTREKARVAEEKIRDLERELRSTQ